MLMIITSQLFIINVMILIATQHNNQIKTNTKSLIIQCAIDPASPLNPSSPTALNAIANAIAPITAIAI